MGEGVKKELPRAVVDVLAAVAIPEEEGNASSTTTDEGARDPPAEAESGTEEPEPEPVVPPHEEL